MTLARTMSIDTSPDASSIPPEELAAASRKKILAGVLGLLCGGLGVHKFVLGNTGAGIAMMATGIGSYAMNLLLALVGPSATWPLPLFLILSMFAIGLIGFIEGVIYLARSDADFYYTYIASRKNWF